MAYAPQQLNSVGAGWWYYKFQFGHGAPLYFSICVSIHAHTGHHNTVTSHERHGVSNHRWLKSLSERNQPVTGGFPTQRGSVAEIWCFLWKFDVSPHKLPIKHKRDQTQERQVNWHTHFDGLVQDCSISTPVLFTVPVFTLIYFVSWFLLPALPPNLAVHEPGDFTFSINASL